MLIPWYSYKVHLAIPAMIIPWCKVHLTIPAMLIPWYTVHLNKWCQVRAADHHEEVRGHTPLQIMLIPWYKVHLTVHNVDSQLLRSQWVLTRHI